MPGLEWLTVGATVAYVYRRGSRVHPAHVDKIGKRDVVVNVSGRIERFNINHTKTHSDGPTWLRRREDSRDPAVYLAPADDPKIVAIAAAQKRDRAVIEVMYRAEVFENSRDTGSGRQLRDAVDTFLEIAEKS